MNCSANIPEPAVNAPVSRSEINESIAAASYQLPTSVVEINWGIQQPAEPMANPNCAELAVAYNDDIVLQKASPGQLSLQKNFDGSGMMGNQLRLETPAGLGGLPQQRSLDMEEPELADFSWQDEELGTRNKTVRYRPPSPRVITPVRFTPTPKLVRKAEARQLPKQPQQQQCHQQQQKQHQQQMSQPQPNIKQPIYLTNSNPATTDSVDIRHNKNTSQLGSTAPASQKADVVDTYPTKIPSRNVSDSGISESASPEPDELAGRIITEQMQKIEAQMKKILQKEDFLL